MQLALGYYKGIVADEVVGNAQMQLANNGIHLHLHDRTNRPEACVTELMSQIYVLMAPSLVQSIATGMLANVAYDALKHSIFMFSSSIPGKTILQIDAVGEKATIPADFGIRFSAGRGSFDLRVPSSASEAIQNKCIEEAFKIIKDNGPGKQDSVEDILNLRNYIGNFDSETGQWALTDRAEFIKQLKDSGEI